MVAYRVGGHELTDAFIFVDNVADRLITMPLFVSDELPHYATALSRRFSSDVLVPMTGKRGKPRKPISVLDPVLMYATVHKTRKKGRIVKVDRHIIF
jgi:hypothetical protein